MWFLVVSKCGGYKVHPPLSIVSGWSCKSPSPLYTVVVTIVAVTIVAVTVWFFVSLLFLVNCSSLNP